MSTLSQAGFLKRCLSRLEGFSPMESSGLSTIGLLVQKRKVGGKSCIVREDRFLFMCAIPAHIGQEIARKNVGKQQLRY